MKTLQFKKYTYALCLLLILSGCKKAWDYIKDHPGGPGDCCRIDEIVYNGSGDGGGPAKDRRLIVTYNDKGKPVSMVHENNDDAGLVNTYFKYDQYNRLSGFMQTYLFPPAFLLWHKYAYTSNPKIIMDTVFSYGEGWPGDRPTGDDVYYGLNKIEMDNFGRVIKISEYFTGSPYVTTYTYNAKGNLTSTSSFYPNSEPQTVIYGAYDNKVSFISTNKVWMFAEKNYSINNPVANIENLYNNFGLPLKLKKTTAINNFLRYVYNYATIKYSCDNRNNKK